MNKRVSIVTVLVILVIGGLFSGIYASTIQHALTLPMLQSMMRTTNQTTPSVASATKPTVIKPAANTATNVQTVMPLAQDTFNRADQPFWGTSSDQRIWEGDANQQQAFSIVKTAGQIAHNQGTFNALLGPVETNTDVMMSAMINQFGDGVNFGAVLRLTDSNNFYKVFVDGTTLTLIKHVNKASSILASKPFQAQGNVSYNLHFRAVAGMLFASVWPGGTTEPKQWMIVTNDTTFTTGQDGVRVVVNPTTVIKVTAFTVTAASLAGEQ